MQEFQNRSEVRIGANPKLISAFIWETWENELGNDKYYLEYLFSSIIENVSYTYIFIVKRDSLYINKNLYFCYMYWVGTKVRSIFSSKIFIF